MALDRSQYNKQFLKALDMLDDMGFGFIAEAAEVSAAKICGTILATNGIDVNQQEQSCTTRRV